MSKDRAELAAMSKQLSEVLARLSSPVWRAKNAGIRNKGEQITWPRGNARTNARHAIGR
jgi:hypothetical protein